LTNTNKSIKTPLRYPGGKSRLVKQILAMAPEEYSEYREPFLGGGSVLFAVHNSKPSIVKKAGDSFQPLYTFWNACKTEPKELYHQVFFGKKLLIGKYLWERCKKTVSDMSPEMRDVDRAAAYFTLNRITFSGLTLSGGYSKASHASRFNISHIDRLNDAHAVMKDVDLRHADYTELLHEPGNNVWIFLDPPYDIKSDNLYGKAGDGHKGFDHVKFAEECRKCKHKWLVTYNDNENIRELFKWANIKEVPVKYSMNSTAKNKVELFITNY